VQFKEKKRKSPGINITSLIDVMFILLIFFMISSSFIEQPGMKLELPASQSREVARVENLIIYISADGRISLNENPVPIDSLGIALKTLVPKAAEKTLVIKADTAAHHGLVVHVMDIAKQSGLQKLVIGTRVEADGQK
jgi:biopolymer transport protein ExbD